MTELSVVEGGSRPGSTLAIRQDQQEFSREQVVALAKMNGWEKVPRAELAVFFHQAQRSGLDPFAKQIYLIGRRNRRENRVDYTIQTSIDGMRLVADRTGRYAGSDRPRFGEDEGDKYAEVTVYKMVAGQRVPFTGVAYEVEFRQERSPMWTKMPRTMLAKCAEAQALRKAFPADLSGIYGSEEMDQANPAVNAPEELGAEVNEEGEVLSVPDRGGATRPEEPEPAEEAEVVEDIGGEEVELAMRRIDEELADWPEGQQEPDADRVKAWARQSAENARKALARVQRLRKDAEDNAAQEEAAEAASALDDEEAVPDFDDMRGAAKESPRPARKSQIDLLRTLAQEGESMAGEGVAVLEERIGKRLAELSHDEADELIEELGS